MFKKNVAIVTFFDKEKSCFFDCLINNYENNRRHCSIQIKINKKY